MASVLTIRLAQVNPTVGDVSGNLALCLSHWGSAAAEGIDLLVFPETVLSGYPADDLVNRPAFLDALERAVHDYAAATAHLPTDTILTTPWRIGEATFNVAILIEKGRISAIRGKHQLPNYGVFDDKRIYASHPVQPPVPWRGHQLGVLICEDVWFAEPSASLVKGGAQILIAPNASPFATDKMTRRNKALSDRVEQTGLPLLYVNQTGGQDDIVYDGHSCAVSAQNQIIAVAKGFHETILDLTIETGDTWQITEARGGAAIASLEAQIYQACLFGLRDYVEKNGFSKVLLGLSGGVDSALVATLAVDALGADRVTGVMLPSEYTSDASLEDAADLAAKLGIKLENHRISAVTEAVHATLPGLSGVTAENLQSRARALLLMALSNQTGALLLTTGNKSEMAVGYATLYGDMCGAYNPIKDLYKTQVYAQCHWRNDNLPDGGLSNAAQPFGASVLNKAPSAELRPDQTDQDSLPPYDVLDGILEGLIEDELSLAELVAKGFETATVQQVMRLLRLAEYKRRQSAPGPKITRRALGRDRRYPITNGFAD